MSDTPTKRPAKKAVAKKAAAPRAPAELEQSSPDTSEPDIPIPADGEVFVIEAVVKRYRYMFRGGKILDVDSPYRADSTDREMALKEAQKRWGGKKDDWKIEGVTTLMDL